MLEAILAFFQALPQLLKLVERFVNHIGAENYKSFLNDLEKSFDKLDQAKTPEEKRDAAKDIVRSIGDL